MKLWFATGNTGKLEEVREKFKAVGVEVVRFESPYPEIQADELADVVEYGLKWLWKKHEQPIMIDDSGLFIDTLGGFPGVYSAYVFKTLGCKGIIGLMADEADKKAHFECCAGFVDSDGRITVKKGVVNGRLIAEERGTGGFGYDPIFVPDGHDRTFAEMALKEKNEISHRGLAFDALAKEIIPGKE